MPRREPRPYYRSQRGLWYVQIAGKQHNLGRDEAKAWKKYHSLMAAARRVVPDTAVQRILDRYYQWCETNLAAATCVHRKRHLKSFAKFVGPRLTIEKLRPHHVQEWIQTHYSDPERHSDTYRHTAISIIKFAMSWAVEMGYVEQSPISRMRKPRPNVRQEFVPVDQWQVIISAASDQSFRDFLVFMLTTGARPQEAVKIEAKHVQDDRIIFPIGQSKGKRRSRVIWLPDQTQEIVARLAKQYPQGPIFRNRNGNPWDKSSIKCRFDRLKKKLKIETLNATMLRHSYAHAQLTNGLDTHTVSKLMGHVDGRMLETRYGHLEQNTEFMRSAANRVPRPDA